MPFNEEEDVNASTRDVHRSCPVPDSLGINHNNLTLVQNSWATEHVKIEERRHVFQTPQSSSSYTAVKVEFELAERHLSRVLQRLEKD